MYKTQTLAPEMRKQLRMMQEVAVLKEFNSRLQQRITELKQKQNDR